MNKPIFIPSSPPAAFTGRGYLLIMLAAVLWAASGTLAKYLFIHSLSPFQLVQARLTVSALALLGWLALRAPQKLSIDRSDWRYFGILGTTGLAAVQFTYLFAISKIHVAAAILLQYLAPSLLALYSVIILRERLHALTALAILTATAGCFLVVGAYRLDLSSMRISGIVSGLASAAAFAWWSAYGEYGMRRYDPWTVLFYATAVAAVVWNVLHAPLEVFCHAYALPVWGAIFAIGILGTLLPFGLYLEGVSRVRATRASITATLEPICAAVMSFVALGEALDAGQITGAVLVIAAVVLLQLKREVDEKAPHLLRSAPASHIRRP